jgi:hypothetical protein
MLVFWRPSSSTGPNPLTRIWTTAGETLLVSASTAVLTAPSAFDAAAVDAAHACCEPVIATMKNSPEMIARLYGDRVFPIMNAPVE